MTESLQKIYDRNRRGDWPDKGSVHSYIEIYETILRPYKYTAKNILEIGLMSGESLRMWSEYFAGTVYGMDCDIKPINGLADLTQTIKDGYNVLIGDAANPQHIAKFFTGIKFDVVIEDANHDIDQQRNIYLALKPYMVRDGIYVIEDIQSIQNAHQLSMELGGQVIDRRHVKNRYDDIILIIK